VPGGSGPANGAPAGQATAKQTANGKDDSDEDWWTE
jgi:hypothetical protein